MESAAGLITLLQLAPFALLCVSWLAFHGGNAPLSHRFAISSWWSAFTVGALAILWTVGAAADPVAFGVDLIAPTSMAVTDDNTPPEEILAMVPDEHRSFALNILAQHQIDTADVYADGAAESGVVQHLRLGVDGDVHDLLKIINI